MPRSLKHRLLVGTARRVPVVRRLPVFKLLALAEIALLARDHLARLEPNERRRLLELFRRGRHLSGDERTELSALVAKAEPRRFAGMAADRLSPVPLPRRIVNGPPRRPASAPR